MIHGSRKEEYQLTLRKQREMIRKIFYLPTYLLQKFSCRETQFILKLEAYLSQARDLKCMMALANTAQHSSQQRWSNSSWQYSNIHSNKTGQPQHSCTAWPYSAQIPPALLTDPSAPQSLNIPTDFVFLSLASR